MILVDTNVISELMKSDRYRAVEDWLDAQVPGSLYAASVSLAEIVFGIERLPDGRRKMLLRTVMEDVVQGQFAGRILPFDEKTARAYGVLIAGARVRGR